MTQRVKEEHPDYITITHGLSGYFAVLVTWSEDFGGYYEPYQTGVERHAKIEDAIAEAKAWACEEVLEFKPNAR
jgi:hypothetical protein